MDEIERKLTAILNADVVGYSRLMADDEVATLRTLNAYRDELALLVAQHRGRVVDSPGDNLLADFPSALDAARCAVEVQRVLAARNADTPAERRLEYRIGVHLGDVMVEGERIYGDGVNIAARLEGLAEPGGICISATVHEQVRGKLEVGYEDLGEQQIKNLPNPVRVYRVTGARPGVAPAAPSSGGDAVRRRRVATALVAAGLAAVAVIAWRALVPSGGLPGAGHGPIRSVAVLPLDNLSGDPGQEYFTDGMTEALIAELSRLQGLRVISRTSVMRYKGTTESLRDIASALSVDAIVEGSVLRADDRVRITAQLIDARSDAHVWAQSYERELENILALQREVAHAVSQKIDPHVGDAAAAPAPAAMRPVNAAAHEAYLKGSYFLERMTPEASLKAVRYLQEAIRLDPGYARAYSRLADAYSCAPTHAWSIPDSQLWPALPQELMAKARGNALRALELDESLAEAHNSLGLVRIFNEWDWAGAEQAFLRAIELDPSYAWGHQAYALLLGFTGRLDQALLEMQRAHKLDPLSPLVTISLAEVHAWRGEQEQALFFWEQALELDEAYPRLHQSFVGDFCRAGLAEQTIPPLESATQSAPDDPLLIADLAYCYAVSGQTQRARELLDRLHELAELTYVSPMSLAMVHVGLGELDAAFAELDRAYDQRAFFLVFVGVDTPFEPLRDDPRFAELLDRVGLPVS